MNNLILVDSYMSRTKMYGHYEMNFVFSIGEDDHHASIITTDAELYDNSVLWGNDERTEAAMLLKIGGIENLVNFIEQ